MDRQIRNRMSIGSLFHHKRKVSFLEAESEMHSKCIVLTISETNKVAAEAEFKAKTAMGTDYENYYHFLFIIENGKVKRMKEYMDTYHAKVTFGL